MDLPHFLAFLHVPSPISPSPPFLPLDPVGFFQGILESVVGDLEDFTLHVHHNYPYFCQDLSEVVEASEDLSLADTYLSDWRVSAEGNELLNGRLRERECVCV